MSYSVSLFSVCGRYCGSCVWYLGERASTCPSCESHVGRPSWGECRTYACVQEHNVEHCGLCGEFPCDHLMHYYDPENPAGPRNAAARVALNAYRARHGDAKALEYLRKVGDLNRPIET